MSMRTAERYMHSILGQQNPHEISKDDTTTKTTAAAAAAASVETETSDGRTLIFLKLLRVDSLFNLGQIDQAKSCLSSLDTIVTSSNSSEEEEKEEEEDGKSSCSSLTYFHRGLKALLDDRLSIAYDNFVQACNHTHGLEAVFYGERAVNIAFWMACSGKMLKAAKPLDVYRRSTPYAGGILSFAMHMNGDSKSAEEIARQAVTIDDFQDLWTIHAIAHCLYSQGRILECIQFIDSYRPIIQKANPSAFMKGHMEFHQALCYIDLENVPGLHDLIDGHLWTSLSHSEQRDYWNAAGLLNIQWKAELRGLSNVVHHASLKQAMDILEGTSSSSPGALASKSAVFSLCILRWSNGTFREEWRLQLMKSDNYILCDLAAAVDAVYPPSPLSAGATAADGFPVFASHVCSNAIEKYLAEHVDNLDKLGASPEQREVIEEFIVIVAKVAGKEQLPIETIDMQNWTKRNYRPNITFYESALGLKGTIEKHDY